MQAAVIEFFADGVALFHAAILAIYIAGAVSVLCGGFLETQLRFWQRGYLALVLIMAVSVVCGADKCPLTRLETAVRAAADPATCYSGSYLEHYVPVLPSMVDQILSVVLLAIGCAGALCAAYSSLQLQETSANVRPE